MSRTTIPPTVRAAVYCIAIASSLVCASLIAMHGTEGWALAAILGVVAVAAGRLHGRASFFAVMSPDDLVLAASVLVLEPRFALAVGLLAGLCGQARFGLVSRALNLAAAGLPTGMASGLLGLGTSAFAGSNPSNRPVVWFVLGSLAILAMSVAHYSLHAVWARAAHGSTDFFPSVAVPMLRIDLICAPVVVALVETGLLLTGVTRLLPVVVAAASFAGIWLFVRAAQRQAEAAHHRDTLNSAIFVALARLLEIRDPDTAIHSARVAIFSRDIAEAIGLSQDEQSRIHLAGLLHDVGKVGVPDDVLLKPGRLSDDERLAMERHARFSAEALAGIPGFGDLARMVYAHHERLDGSGYPEGTQGDDIPLGARILAVADTFEAITSNRPYRTARSREVALSILKDEVHLFDQAVVDGLCEVLRTGWTAPESGSEDLTDFAREWSIAGQNLVPDLDAQPFSLPPERTRPAAKIPASAVPERMKQAVQPHIASSPHSGVRA
jgi:HD domain